MKTFTQTNNVKVQKEVRDVTQGEKKEQVIMCDCDVCVVDAGAVAFQFPPFSSLCHCSHGGIPRSTFCNAAVSVILGFLFSFWNASLCLSLSCYLQVVLCWAKRRGRFHFIFSGDFCRFVQNNFDNVVDTTWGIKTGMVDNEEHLKCCVLQLYFFSWAFVRSSQAYNFFSIASVDASSLFSLLQFFKVNEH